MEYKCEFCDTIYPTSYMIRQHTNTAHDVTINRKLNKFIEKVEQFMKKVEQFMEKNKIYYFKGLK